MKQPVFRQASEVFKAAALSGACFDLSLDAAGRLTSCAQTPICEMETRRPMQTQDAVRFIISSESARDRTETPAGEISTLVVNSSSRRDRVLPALRRCSLNAPKLESCVLFLSQSSAGVPAGILRAQKSANAGPMDGANHKARKRFCIPVTTLPVARICNPRMPAQMPAQLKSS